MKFFLARSTEHGSRSLVNAVEGGEETHGQYLENCEIEQYVSSDHSCPSFEGELQGGNRLTVGS